MSSNKISKKQLSGLLIFILASVILIIIDQLTKMAAYNALCNKKDIPVIKDVLELSYLENTGAAWGMLSGRIHFFIILTVIIVAIITYIVIRMPVDRKYIYLRIVCIMLTAGAIGNFIDRVRFGYVRDFIYFKLINFPIFNVADCYVTISVAIFAVLILFYYKDDDFAFLSFRKGSKDN
ncbi:MAG: signal peptidase II [Lachnospira sp.]